MLLPLSSLIADGIIQVFLENIVTTRRAPPPPPLYSNLCIFEGHTSLGYLWGKGCQQNVNLSSHAADMFIISFSQENLDLLIVVEFSTSLI